MVTRPEVLDALHNTSTPLGPPPPKPGAVPGGTEGSRATAGPAGRRKPAEGPARTGYRVDWGACLPQGEGLEDLEKFMRKLQADKQSRVSVAQSIAYGLSLAEASTAQHHCALIGVRFTTSVVLGPKRVALELSEWPSTPEVVGIRTLLDNLSHSSLPHSLLDHQHRLDVGAVKRLHNQLQHSIMLQADRSSEEPLAWKSPSHGTDNPRAEQMPTAGFPSTATDFCVEEADRLSIVNATRSVATTSKGRKSKTALAHSCSTLTTSSRHPDGDGGGDGAGAPSSGPGSAGARGARAPARGSASSVAPRSSNTGSRSTGSRQRLATTSISSDNTLGLDLSAPLAAIDITDQLGPEDFEGENDANLSLRLGEDAASFAAMADLDPALLASLRTAEEKGARSVQAWAQDPEHADVVLHVLTEALDELGCEVLVLSPAQMDKLRSERAADTSAAARAPVRSPAPAGPSPTLPDLVFSDGTGSPSPLSTARLPLSPLPHLPPLSDSGQGGDTAHGEQREQAAGAERIASALAQAAAAGDPPPQPATLRRSSRSARSLKAAPETGRTSRWFRSS